MPEWMQKNLKYPRLTFLGLGFLMGLLLAITVGYQFTTRIEELEKIRVSQIHEKEQRVLQLESQYSKLMTEHRKMKSHIHITERTNADGSTEKLYDSKKSIESELKVVEHATTIQKLNYQRKIDLINYEWEKKLIKESRPSANLSIGIDSNFERFIHVNYTIYGPVTFGILGTQSGTYGLTLGVSL